MRQARTPRHAAARVEDVLHSSLAVVLRRRGWVPRIVTYTGYGGPGWVRVFGRVLAARPPRPGAPEPTDFAQLARWGRSLDREQMRAAVSALRGWRSFINVPLAGVLVDVEVGAQRHRVVTDRGGYVDVRLPSDLPPGTQEVILRVAGTASSTPDAVEELLAGAEPARAPIVVVGPDETFGVVSDIDDTVMVTSLPRPFIAFWNTFVLHEQARRPVPGMAELLTAAARAHPGAPIIYLSTGAWNVAPLLTRFMARYGFPPGPLLLTDWGPTNTGWFRSGQEHKRAALRRLREELPQVQWLLVGDDGQHDPVIYREFAEQVPSAVRAIAIRQLSVAEQVLSHGLPVPVTAASRSPRTVADVRAPDGDGLKHQLVQAGLL